MRSMKEGEHKAVPPLQNCYCPRSSFLHPDHLNCYCPSKRESTKQFHNSKMKFPFVSPPLTNAHRSPPPNDASSLNLSNAPTVVNYKNLSFSYPFSIFFSDSSSIFFSDILVDSVFSLPPDSSSTFPSDLQSVTKTLSSSVTKTLSSQHSLKMSLVYVFSHLLTAKFSAANNITT